MRRNEFSLRNLPFTMGLEELDFLQGVIDGEDEIEQTTVHIGGRYSNTIRFFSNYSKEAIDEIIRAQGLLDNSIMFEEIPFRLLGVVKFYSPDKVGGFITCLDGLDYHVTKRNLEMAGIESLEKDTLVSFTPVGDNSINNLNIEEFKFSGAIARFGKDFPHRIINVKGYEGTVFVFHTEVNKVGAEKLKPGTLVKFRLRLKNKSKPDPKNPLVHFEAYDIEL